MIRDRVIRLLEELGVEFALIGAVAVAARGAPRSTMDFDLLTTDKRVLLESTWQPLSDVPVDVRKGDWDDPLAGVVRIGAKPEQIDIVVGRWKWEHRVIQRAEITAVEGQKIRVPLTSDLILLKLAAGGPIDQQDILRLLAVGPREQLLREVDEKVGDLPDDAQALWRQLVTASS